MELPNKRNHRNVFIVIVLLMVSIYGLFYFEAPLSTGYIRWTFNDTSKEPLPRYVAPSPNYQSDTKNIVSGQNKSSGTSVTASVDRSSSTSEKHHVVFLKIHKAASSTMQNILLRFAMSRNLNVLFMDRSLHLNEGGTQIRAGSLMKHPKGMQFDILCNHLIYSRSQIAPYFPKDTVYIGIVREPFRQFKSAFVYYSQVFRGSATRIIAQYPRDPIHSFLQNPWKFNLGHPRRTKLNNRMSVDFGFPVSENFEADKKDTGKIEDFIRRVHKEIDLVLISDFFHESLILLRRFMNWSLKDVLYCKSNVFKLISKSDKKQWINRDNYTKEDLDNFRKWAAIDYALYEKSLEVFQNKIKMEDRFQAEVGTFKKIQESLSEFCQSVVGSDMNDNRTLIIGENEWTKSFSVTTTDCHRMTMGEGKIVNVAKGIQRERMTKLLATSTP